MNINKDIVKLAIPAIFTNITIPLLGLIDLSIAGHLNNSILIGAIAIGTTMFNLLYWNFSFLRMGTTGMTAQFFGKDDDYHLSLVLYRALTIAIGIGILIIILQRPLRELAIWLLSPSAEVEHYAISYYDICIWGAPAFLSVIVFKGWLFGVQNAKYPLLIAVSINILNIIFSLLSVFVFGFGFIGIAIGSLLAEYMGLVLSVILIISRYRRFLHHLLIKDLLNGAGLRKFFKVNSDIFVRSFFILCVNLSFTAIGARAGNDILAVNAVIMQLFFFYSYFMDGFAFAGEAVIGKLTGAANQHALKRAIKLLFYWGIGVAIAFSIIYGGFLSPIVHILTDDSKIQQEIINNRLWCIIIPIAGVGAFIWDGIFIGFTATRQMVFATLTAALGFFATYFIEYSGFSYSRLWLAFIVFLILRAAVLSISYYRIRTNIH